MGDNFTYLVIGYRRKLLIGGKKKKLQHINYLRENRRFTNLNINETLDTF